MIVVTSAYIAEETGTLDGVADGRPQLCDVKGRVQPAVTSQSGVWVRGAYTDRIGMADMHAA